MLSKYVTAMSAKLQLVILECTGNSAACPALDPPTASMAYAIGTLDIVAGVNRQGGVCSVIYLALTV